LFEKKHAVSKSNIDEVGVFLAEISVMVCLKMGDAPKFPFP
jgi:hypothetical protein